MTPLDVDAPGDAIGVGVFWPFVASANAVSITTEPDALPVAYVVAPQADGGVGTPVVVHKTF